MGGEEVWEPRFTFHGFQYAEVHGLGVEGRIVVEAVVLHSEMERTGYFSCSNVLLNRLFENIVWGQKGNFLDVPMDCPQRDERLGWTGDAQVFVRTASYLFDVQCFFRKWMQDVADAQSEDGGIPPFCPNPNNPFNLDFDGGPAWSDAVTICPWTIYLCYGDVEILRRSYGVMMRWLDYVERERTLDCIRNCREVDAWGGFGDWLALEYMSDGDECGKTPKDLIGTAMYAYSVDIVARTAKLLGKGEDELKYRALHGAVVEAFQRRFVTPDGLVVGNTQTAFVLALYFDLLPEGKSQCVVDDLVANIRGRGVHLGTGFVGTPYILDVLEEHGHLDVAYGLLEQTTFPSWLFPVTHGATTIWERWDGWHPERGFQKVAMNSFNHYAYGAVGAWMVRSVAGLDVDPEKPGYQQTIFRPRPGGTLRFAEACLESVAGFVAIRWELGEDEGLRVTMDVPDGASGVFDPPGGWVGESELLGSGSHERFLERLSQG